MANYNRISNGWRMAGGLDLMTTGTCCGHFKFRCDRPLIGWIFNQLPKIAQPWEVECILGQIQIHATQTCRISNNNIVNGPLFVALAAISPFTSFCL